MHFTIVPLPLLITLFAGMVGAAPVPAPHLSGVEHPHHGEIHIRQYEGAAILEFVKRGGNGLASNKAKKIPAKVITDINKVLKNPDAGKVRGQKGGQQSPGNGAQKDGKGQLGTAGGNQGKVGGGK